MTCFTNAYKIYVKTTNTCNLNCTHCYTGGKLPNMETFDGASVISFLKNMLKEFPTIGSFEYAFHGGEPMLVPVSHMNSFIEQAKALGVESLFGIQTNLVFKMTDERLAFLKSLDFVGTSWDYDIRFTTRNQEAQWRENVEILVKEGVSLHTTVSLTRRMVTETEPITIIDLMAKMGIKNILFERLTSTGTAAKSPEIFPNSEELRQYFLKMWKQSIEHKTYEKIHNLFLEPTVQMYLNNGPVAGQRRCRGCEKQILTFNSNGTIGGCADGALENIFGTVHERPSDVLKSKSRLTTIAKEQVINPACLECDVYTLCRGDCYKQEHDEFGCMAPKEVFRDLKSTKDRELYKLFSTSQLEK